MRNWRFALVASVFGCWLLSLTTSAAGAVVSVRLGRPEVVLQPAVSDGARYVAYQTSATKAVLLDTESGRNTQLALPVSCPLLYYQSGQGVVAVGGGQLLLSCSQIYVYDITRGVWSVPRGIEQFANDARQSGAEYTFDGVGRDWLAASEYFPHESAAAYLNWRTGRLVREVGSGPGEEFGPGRVPDLGVATGQQKLCAPLRRQLNPDYSGPDLPYADAPYYLGYLFDGRYGISLSTPPPSGTFDEAFAGLRVSRCGGRRPLVLTRGAAVSIQLGGGVVSWLDRKQNIHAVRLSDRRDYRAVVSQHAISGPAVSHTARQLVVSYLDRAHRWTIQRGTLR